MKIHFLKTIWSDIILLQENDHFAFIDTGFQEQFPQIQEYLSALQVKNIDFILLTHFHRDHYGSIPLLLENYEVGTVYFKEYSGLDYSTAWGTEADDAYRALEMQKYLNMQKLISEKSRLVQVEDIHNITFCGHTLELFSNQNSIRTIYEDATHPETYHKITFSENQNSLAAFMTVAGKNIFFGGDVLDHASSHPLANYVNLQIAQKLKSEIDIYKVPHHATYNTGLPETLSIFKPKTAVITNEEAYLTTTSDALANIRNANPNVRILLTEKDTVVLTVS